MNTSKFVDSITGFNKWLMAWKNWHLGITGRPDCKICEGTGTEYVSDGHDDVNAEVCNCMKHE